MLHALAEAPGDFRAALDTFPENLKRLFVNAAQSVVFNRILSRRLEAGLPFHEPVAGDVVAFADTDAPADFPIPDVDRAQRVSAERTDVLARHCERDRAVVTAPLVGTETELAEGEPGEIERAVLADLDLSPADFDLPEPYHSTGTRRAILLRVEPTITQDPLTFAFSLPKGSYATVLLREYLKGSPRDR
jgi:tRNA pseudouridine13 synthase